MISTETQEIFIKYRVAMLIENIDKETDLKVFHMTLLV